MRISTRTATATLLGCLLVSSAACSGGATPRAGSGSTRPTPTGTVTPYLGTGWTREVRTLHALMDSAVQAKLAPGLVVLIRRNGRETVLVSGAARQRPAAPMVATDRFRIGGVTGVLVATAALRLVERHRLSLKARVADLLPGVLPDGARRVTVEQLLNQTSGLADYTTTPGFGALLARQPVAPRDLVRLANSRPPAFRPGSRQAESSTNLILVGMLLERLTGKPLATVLQDEVFGPLEMTSTALAPRRATAGALAHGYDAGADVTRRSLSYAWAAGGVVSDAPDLATFLSALFGGRFLAPDTQRLLTTPPRVVARTGQGWRGVALGVAREPVDCGFVWGADGRLPGFATDAWTSADGRRAVVVLVNAATPQLRGTIGSIADAALCPH